jgi:hypothetical protein
MVIKEKDELVLHLISVDNDIHSVIDKASILFLYNINSEEIEYFVIDHQDDEVSKIEEVIKYINDIPTRKWVLDKKSILNIIPQLNNLYDINLYTHLKNNIITEYSTFKTIAHLIIEKNVEGGKYDKINKIIPLVKHYESFKNFCNYIKKYINNIELDNGYNITNDIFIKALSDVEKNGIYVNSELFKKYYPNNKVNNNLVYSQYNLYTSTGRPSNAYNNVNFSALNKETGIRECFISRYKNEGEMLLIDYSAFHPRLISYLIKFDIPHNVNIYEYLGKLYFNKEELTEEEINQSKVLTFRQLYGGIENKYSHIRYFNELKKYIDNMWEFYKINDYVETPLFKRKIYSKHIFEVNPNKLFNYILQAMETEVGIYALYNINKLLINKYTRPILYTYDSILFDHYKQEKDDIIDIIKIMTYNEKFPVKIYSGNSYGNLIKKEF